MSFLKFKDMLYTDTFLTGISQSRILLLDISVGWISSSKTWNPSKTVNACDEAGRCSGQPKVLKMTRSQKKHLFAHKPGMQVLRLT